MAFGEGLLSAVPSLFWIVLHVGVALGAVYFWSRARDRLLSASFVLFALFGVIGALSGLGVVDVLTAYGLGVLLAAAALVLVGVHVQQIA